MFLHLRARLEMWWLERCIARRKQHWQAGAIGGGAIVQLGFLTETQALAKVRTIKGENDPIAFVDTERGFIAYGKHPEASL